MNLIDQEVRERTIEILIPYLKKSEFERAGEEVKKIGEHMYSIIPPKRRISYGRYSVVKFLSKYLFEEFEAVGVDTLSAAKALFDSFNDRYVSATSLSIITFCGLKDYRVALPYLEKAAMSDSWEVREDSAGFVRKLFKKFPEEMKKYYIKLVKSDNPNLRRFACESIRPVADNWFKKDPKTTFKIISHLFQESDPYPRTSIGNNLSDWARIDPEMVYGYLNKLVDSGDKNSYWIAYRACRNLVKKEPIRVMDLLGIDEYKYKTRVHYRKDYQK